MKRRWSRGFSFPNKAETNLDATVIVNLKAPITAMAFPQAPARCEPHGPMIRAERQHYSPGQSDGGLVGLVTPVTAVVANLNAWDNNGSTQTRRVAGY